MAAEGIAAEQNDVEGENDRSEADAEVFVTGIPIEEPHRPIRVAGENHQKDEREIKEVAVDVLDYERKISLAAVAVAGLADGAVRRVRPEAFVVRSPIVVAGEPESGGKRQDQQRGRKRQKRRNPRWPGAVDPGVRRVGKKQRRVERR